MTHAQTRQNKSQPADSYVRKKRVSVEHAHSIKAVLQTKLKIGQPNDKYEQEADRVSQQVMQMPQQSTRGVRIQRACAACQDEHETLLQKKAASNPNKSTKQTGSPQKSAAGANLSGSNGRKLDQQTRSFMENRFGADFSTVRIHTDQQSHSMAGHLHAQAFTVGNHIYFNQDKYSPGSAAGKQLLAHELTHTIQQGHVGALMIQRTVEADDVSCGNYDSDHPTIRTIGTEDPVGVINQACETAIAYLDNVIAELQASRRSIVDEGNPAGWPAINDCVGLAINLRFRRFDAGNDAFWSSRRGASRLIQWYTDIRRILASGTMKYTCITDYAFCGRDTWAGAAFGRRRIYFCLPFWERATLPERALTIIHETSHTYFNTDDHNGRTMANAHCIEQFVADINGIGITGEFANACGGANPACSG